MLGYVLLERDIFHTIYTRTAKTTLQVIRRLCVWGEGRGAQSSTRLAKESFKDPQGASRKDSQSDSREDAPAVSNETPHARMFRRSLHLLQQPMAMP